MAYPQPDGTIALKADHLTAKVRALNDTSRRSFIGGQVTETPGVVELREVERIALQLSVRRFDADDDPYNEQDFDSIKIGGRASSGRSMPTIVPCLAIRRTPPTQA